MSMVALAMRLTLCQALRGQTLAGDAIYDSNVRELDDLVKEGQTKHVITIATDEQAGTFEGYSYLTASRTLDLVIEIAVAQGVRVQVQAEQDSPPQEAVVVDVAHTDEGLELVVDLIARQVFRVIQAGDGWADLFRLFAGKPTKFTSKRGAGWEKGVRFAARQIVVTYEPLAEPNFGVMPVEGDAFGRLIAALGEAEGPIRRYAGLIGKAIVGEAIPDWRRLQAELGLTTDGMAAAGLGPLLPGEAPIAAGTLESDGDHLAVTTEAETP